MKKPSRATATRKIVPPHWPSSDIDGLAINAISATPPQTTSSSRPATTPMMRRVDIDGRAIVAE